MRVKRALREGWSLCEVLPGDTPTSLQRGVMDDQHRWLDARLPAQVHDILLAHKAIPDPRVGRNAAASAWVGEKSWAYVGGFESPSGDGPVFLRFEGLDTLATVYLNEREIGRLTNMHCHHTRQVRAELRPPGEANTLLILFDAPLGYVNEIEQQGSPGGVPAHHWLRKCKSDFSSYMGARPHSAKVGIFADIVLDAPDRTWFEDVWVRTRLTDDLAQAEMIAKVKVGGETASAIEWVLLDPAGQAVACGATTSSDCVIRCPISEPLLWWPRSHGTPHLYTLQVDLLLEGKLRDRRCVPFGVRQVKHVTQERTTGEPCFAFEVNNQRIFLQGACWAPLEGMTHCWSDERAEYLLDLAEQAHMNVLRVWGGGTVPPDAFYEACDRRGILIWQDFMFGYGKHPSTPEFLENCRLEIEDVVRRLRNHPSLLMWCGGNENHMGWDFQQGTRPEDGWELFGQLMPELCRTLDPDRSFHPSSPFGGAVPNWPQEGDWHDYTTITFSPQASVPLYASEIGRVSAPSLASLRRFMGEEEIWPAGHSAAITEPGRAAWPPLWQYRSVDGSWDKIGAIESLCEPRDAAGLVRVLGTAHGEYLRERVERHRRGVPDGADAGSKRCWGTTIWRLNDSWPILYWSAIDYYLQPKIPYHYLRRAYRPVLVSFERTADRIAVWVTNDSADFVAGELHLLRRKFTGEVLGDLACVVSVEPGQSIRCLDATPLGPINLRAEFLEARLGDQVALHTLLAERYLHLPAATLAVRRQGNHLQIATDVYARQVTLSLDGDTGVPVGDNYFDLAPGASQWVHLPDSLRGQLEITALNASPIKFDIEGE